MTTVGEAVATVERDLLVPRKREMGIFRDWLASAPPTAELLNVSGPPGVGKTSLLSAFAREARMLGRDVALADGHCVGPTEQDFVRGLNNGRSADLEDLIARLNQQRSLVVIDTFEQLEHLTTFLQVKLLPLLETGVKVVIAGRRPLLLAWSRADAWPKIVRLLPLDGFSSGESRLYLARRGIRRPELTDQVVRATAGNPLALSVAADLIAQLDMRDFASDPRWQLAARSLARRLLSEAADDPDLVAAIEACSVVRIFDEATLYAMTGNDDVSRVFDRLCRLSIIKPAANGLMLQDHVRAIISRDLRWRRPRHHQLLRQRALDHFKERLRNSDEAERGWLIIECFFLWDNLIVREIFFGPETLGSVTVGPVEGIDPNALLELYAGWTTHVLQFGVDSRLLSDVLAFPHTRVRVAKDADGSLVGFSMVLPLSQRSIGFLERHPVHAELVAAYFHPARRAMLPTNPEDATTFYLLPVVAAIEDKGAVRCALFRELASVFGLNGTYLCLSREPLVDRLLAECHFEMVTAADQSNSAVKGWVLDLTRVGFEGWIQAVVAGRQVQPPPSSCDLEIEILAALNHWADSAWLADNCRLIAGGVALPERAELTRRTIQDAFSRARGDAQGSNDKALRVLELAYFKRNVSHKQAMRSLSVSRATFYRLCRRGVRAIAEHLVRP